MNLERWRPVLLGLLGFFITVSICLLAMFIVNYYGKQNELNTWNHGGKYVKECPRLGGFPVLFRDYLPAQYQVAQALVELEQQVNKQIPMGKIWQKWEGQATTVFPVVDFLPAKETEYRNGGFCHWTTATLGWMLTDWHNGRPLATKVYICTRTIEDAYANKEKARYWQRLNNKKLEEYWKIVTFGRKNIVKHEGGHALWGGHPKWGCGLMCSKPRVAHIDSHAIAILQKHVYAVCKANNLLNMNR